VRLLRGRVLQPRKNGACRRTIGAAERRPQEPHRPPTPSQRQPLRARLELPFWIDPVGVTIWPVAIRRARLGVHPGVYSLPVAAERVGDLGDARGARVLHRSSVLIKVIANLIEFSRELAFPLRSFAQIAPGERDPIERIIGLSHVVFAVVHERYCSGGLLLVFIRIHR